MSTPPSHTWSVPRLAAISVLGAAWVAILGLGFWLGADRLLLATDGRYYLTMATSRVGFDWPWFSDSIDFLHGIGDQLFPFRPEVIPFFRILTALGFGNGAKIAGFLWLRRCGTDCWRCLSGPELWTDFLCRNRRQRGHAGLYAASLEVRGGLLLRSYCSAIQQPGRCNGHSGRPLSPVLAGPRSLLISFLLVGLAGALLWFVLASPLAFMLPAPLLCITFVVGLCAASDAGERWRKLTALGFLLLLAACGPVWYLLAEVMSSAAFVFNIELQNSLATWGFASIIFHGLMGPVLVASAAVSAVLNRNNENRTLRFFGYGIITYLTSRLTFAWLTITFSISGAARRQSTSNFL